MARNRATFGHATKSGSSQRTRGRRTGVGIPNFLNEDQSKLEDFGEYLAGAQTPSSTPDDQKEVVDDNSGEIDDKRKVRFSLGENPPSDDVSSFMNDASPIMNMHNFQDRLMRTSSDSISLSELSPVSTAPPSASKPNVVTQIDDSTDANHVAATGGTVEGEGVTELGQDSSFILMDADFPQPDDDAGDNVVDTLEKDDLELPRTSAPDGLETPTQDSNAHLEVSIAADGLGVSRTAESFQTPTPDTNAHLEELVVNEEHDDDDLLPPPPPDSPERILDDSNKDSDYRSKTRISPPVAESEEGLEDDDDKEGNGFDVVVDESDEELEQSSDAADASLVQQKLSRRTKITKKRKGRAPNSSQNMTEPHGQKAGKKGKGKRSKYAVVWSPEGRVAGPRPYEAVPVSDLREPPPEDTQLRRSQRARIKPLAFWKNERVVYGPSEGSEDHDGGVLSKLSMRNMPVPLAISKAGPTPRKIREAVHRKHPPSRAPGRETGNNAQNAGNFDSSKIRKKLNINAGDEARLWDEGCEAALDMKVVAYADSLVELELGPSKNTKKRTKEEGNVRGLASQAFNVPGNPKSVYPGYIMGHLRLPPKGIKDAESVGSCAQTFTVIQGQNESLEIAYAHADNDEGAFDPSTAQRFLLGPGDMFRIPPGNGYRLQNHSSDTDCVLTWTIIQPLR